MTPPRAMILAAGRGERMRPLTDTCPKPLLPVRGRALARWWIDALARDGMREVVVNTAWLGEQVEAQLGAGGAAPAGLSVRFSSEGRDFGRALETAGGIARALPWLAARAEDAFWVVAGDVFAPDFSFDAAALASFAASGRLAHLWLVPNPAHHPAGDFAIGPGGVALNDAPPGQRRHTFSTIALYRRALFELPWCDIAPGNPQGIAAPLASLLRRAIDAGRVSAELYAGPWADVGTPERLAVLNAGGS